MTLVSVHVACDNLDDYPPSRPWSEQCWDTDQKTDLSRCSLDTDLEDTAGVCANKVCVPLTCDNGNCVVFDTSATPLPDTNQKSCYDGEKKLAEGKCPLPHETYYGQDAQYGSDAEPADGTIRFEVDRSNADQPIVIDKVTGKTWQGCAAGYKGANCGTRDEDGLASGKTSQDNAERYCASLDWGVFKDGWYLPDKMVLESILHLGTDQAPLVNHEIFPSSTPLGETAGKFWSLSPSESGNQPFYVDFTNGHISFCPETGEYSVRCVRNSTDTVDKTVLEWQRCTPPKDQEEDIRCVKLAWKEALAYCEMLAWNGSEEWRLPNRRELMSFIDESPRFDDDFWSSSSVAYTDDASHAWTVSGYDGKVWDYDKKEKRYVRCVRNSP